MVIYFICLQTLLITLLTDNICADNIFCILLLFHIIWNFIISWGCAVHVSVYRFSKIHSIKLSHIAKLMDSESDKMHLLEKASNYSEPRNVSLESGYSILLKEQLTPKKCFVYKPFCFYIMYFSILCSLSLRTFTRKQDLHFSGVHLLALLIFSLKSQSNVYDIILTFRGTKLIIMKNQLETNQLESENTFRFCLLT